MSRFTLAAVAEMMDYKNLNAYDNPMQAPSADLAEPLEAQGVVDWMLQAERFKSTNKAASNSLQA